MKRTSLLLVFLLAGCQERREAAASGGPFDPLQFFTGHSAGKAKLHLVTGSTREVTVDSMGTPDGRGGLMLEQAITEQRKAPRVRRWVLRPNGANHWTGTLTDAKGPVDVDRTATDVVIRYRMKSGPEVEQHLELVSPGVAENHMSVTRFGVQIATLDEHIRKLAK